MMNKFGPLVSTNELHTLCRELAPGVRYHITNVPTIVRRGGHLPDAREYYTFATAGRLQYLRELARICAAQGQADVRLDFDDDISVGRRSFYARKRQRIEPYRKRYQVRTSDVDATRARGVRYRGRLKAGYNTGFTKLPPVEG